MITPLRIAFLIVLIGTTVETLTTQSRQALKIQRWRSRVRNHTIVVGYGTKGRTAVAAMVGDEVAPGRHRRRRRPNAAALERAKSAGLVTVHGDATKSEVLRLAGAQHAKSIIVATDRDATAVLVTLTARELAPKAKIIAAAREAENQHLLQQSGADSTVVSSETAGRLLGIATQTPSVVEMMEDLLTPDAGFAHRRTRGRAQGGRRLAAAPDRHRARRGPRRPAAARRRSRRSTPSSSATGCCTSAARKPSDERRADVFELRNVPLLSRVGADRADALRTDIDAAVAGWPDAAVLRVDSRNQVLISDGRVVLGKATKLGDKPTEHAVFLGRLPDGRHVWAVRARAGGAGRSAQRNRGARPSPRRARSSTTSARSWWRPPPRC